MTAWLHLCLGEVAIAHAATYPSRADEYVSTLEDLGKQAGINERSCLAENARTGDHDLAIARHLGNVGFLR